MTIDDVRRVAEQLPRSYEVLVRDRVKFRVGRIVWLAFSSDETQMGFAFPIQSMFILSIRLLALQGNFQALLHKRFAHFGNRDR